MNNKGFTTEEQKAFKERYGFDPTPNDFKPKSLRERMLEEGKMYAEINKRDSKKNNNSN